MGDMTKKVDKKDISLFLFLTFMAILLKRIKLEFFFGAILDLSSIFLIIILLNWGRRRAIITTIFVITVDIIIFKGTYIDIFFLIEIILLSFLIKKRRRNIITFDTLYWIFISVPIVLNLYLNKQQINYINKYSFELLFVSINGILNTFIGEISYLFLVKAKYYKKKVTIKIKEILLYITIAAMFIPFIINIYVGLIDEYQYITSIAETSAKEIFQYIKDELESWDEKKVINLRLGAVLEVGNLTKDIKANSKYKPFNVNIKDKDNRIILNVKNNKKYIEDYSLYEKTLINEHLYRYLPEKKNKIYGSSWIDGYFIYDNYLQDIELRVIIEIPMEIYRDRIINEYINQYKFLMLFTVFLVIIVGILNKVISADVTTLSLNTKNILKSINNSLNLDWPNTSIVEIETLSTNIKNMALELKDNFLKIKESEEKLYELAYFDSLTNLPNRLYFKELLAKVVDNKPSKKIAVIFIDLNRFKIINDTLGHDTGDKLLSSVADRLRKIQGNGTNIFRLGGDEFVVVSAVEKIEEINKVGDKITEQFKEEFILENVVLGVKCSMGVSIYPDDSRDINTIIKYADIAMYKSKENGGNYLQFFNDTIKDIVVKKLIVEKEIYRALEQNEFSLYYQPKYSSVTGEVESLEALIRWNSSNLGVVPPEMFINVAEESDLILKIDNWVIRQAIKDALVIHDIIGKKIPVSINISAKHFAGKELQTIIEEALRKSKLEAKYLIVEITEGILIKNVEAVREIINNLRKIGIKISIDDFGKGYSSFNQLLELPINEVKIDKGFITDIDKNEKQQNIVRVMIELAHTLNLNVVAEGIERKEESDYLKAIHCDELQGYLFSKPVKKEKLKELFKETEKV